MNELLIRVKSSRLMLHAPAFVVLWLLLSRLNVAIDPLYSYYLALVAMYATAMLGMVILVGLSGQVSLGNGALMAVGGYVFALTSLNWKTVPLLGLPWNAVWSVIFAALGGIIVGLIIGLLAARLQGPYLAGFTLGIAVGLPAIANRFPEVLGGSQGFKLTVPYPEGGYADAAADEAAAQTAAQTDEAALDEFLVDDSAAPVDSASAAPEETVAPDDLLTVDDLGGGAGAGSSVEPSAAPEETVAPGDLLTVDDLSGGAASGAPSVEPTPEPSASVSTSVSATPSGTVTDPGFIIEQWQASVAIAVACIAGFVALNLVRGRQGQLWRAVRDDPIAAALVGISPSMSKVSAFVVSSLFAALAGAVFAQILTYVGPGAYSVGLSLSLLVGVILGGRSSLLGAVIGAVLIVGLPEVVANLAGDRGWSEQVSNNMPNLIYGLLLVVVVLVAPGGVVGTIQSAWSRARRPRTTV